MGFFMNSSAYHNQLLPYIQGTKVSSISKQAIRITKILIPTPNEQTAIATALSDAHSLTSVLDKKIEKKKLIKQGAMQQLLTGKKRLPGFAGEYKSILIEDLFEVVAGGDLDVVHYSLHRTEKYEYPIYSNSLDDQGLYGYTSRPHYPQNSITITGRGALGHSEYRESPFDAIVRLLVLIPINKNAVDCFYISELITIYVHLFMKAQEFRN